MIKRPIIIAVAVGVLVAGMMTVSTATPVAVAASEPSSGWPSLLETSLPGGAAVDQVQAFAVPPSSDAEQVGDVKSLVSLPAALVTTGSRFSVLVDPTAVPVDYRRPDGAVDFSVFVRDVHGQSWTTFTTARGGAVPSSAGAESTTGSDVDHVWVDAVDTDEILSGSTADSGYPVLEGEQSDEVAATSSADFDDEAVDVNPYEFVEAEIPSAPAATGNDCLKETYTGDLIRPATIGTSYPVGTATSWMEHTNERTSTSDLGVAVGPQAANGSIEWKQGGTKYTTGSWSGLWGASGAKRSYRIRTNYHKYILGKGCNGAVHYRRPHIETGGALTNTNGLTRPDWNEFCEPQPRNYTFIRLDSEGKAYSYGAAVKFKDLIGIDLSLKKNYNKSNTLSYHFGSGARHKLCGNNDYPSVAGKLIDRFN